MLGEGYDTRLNILCGHSEYWKHICLQMWLDNTSYELVYFKHTESLTFPQVNPATLGPSAHAFETISAAVATTAGPKNK